MNSSVILLLLAIRSAVLLTVKASPVHIKSDNRNIIVTVTTERNLQQLNRYTTTIQIYRQLVRAWQTIWFLLKKHVRI